MAASLLGTCSLGAQAPEPPRFHLSASAPGSPGDVPAFESYTADNLLAAAGIGVRWIAEPEEKATVRLDYAWGKDRGALYLSIGEAF